MNNLRNSNKHLESRQRSDTKIFLNNDSLKYVNLMKIPSG